MLSRNAIFSWIGIILLSSMFLMGQDTWPPQPTCSDVDEDGYGNPADASCTYPELDCDDSDPEVNPGEIELCGDSKDNDCDGGVDCYDFECGGDPNACWYCDIFAQDCQEETEACYLFYFDTPGYPDPGMGTQCITTSLQGNDGLQGDLCEFINACAGGYSCILSDQADLTCAYVCDATGSGGSTCGDAGGPGSSFTCVSIKEVYTELTVVPDEVGVCLDCAEWPTLPTCM